MPTKKQHFVPRVYMKAWETQVETHKEPDKKFNGIYVIKDGSTGDGANRNSVLWKPHLYTINFKYSFICNSCAKVKSQFVDMIYELLRNGFKQPVYGKLGYSIIKTKKSIKKHFFEIHDWDFYYDDGNVAKKAAILSQIDALNCYILEESFDDYLEKNDLFNKIDLIITHHPFIFGTKYKVFKYDENKKELCALIDEKDIPIYSYHTNFDEGKDGMNDALAKRLELIDIKPLESDPMARGGKLPFEMNIEDFAKYAMNKFDVDYSMLLNYGKSTIKSVAVVGGGGWRSFSIAMKENYDIFISGDIPHHGRREVISNKYNYLDMPHEIEKIFMEAFKNKLHEIAPDIEVISIDHEKLPKIILK